MDAGGEQLLQKNGRLAFALAFAVLLSSCSSAAASSASAKSEEAAAQTGQAVSAVSQAASVPVPVQSSVSVSDTSTPEAAASSTQGYPMPAFQDSVYDASAAEGNDSVRIDLSHTSLGYVAVSARSEPRLKFRVILGDIVYTHDLPGDGTPTIYPLQSGDGTYTLQVFQNISGKQYALLYETTAQVALLDAFEPFLRPSQTVNYTADSQCVALMAQLAQGCTTDAEAAAAVYRYLTENISYDYDKAANVQDGYLPDPDATLAQGKGICFDYAALAAAMLRSAGIPTKLVKGYVGDVYHAWNLIYLKNEGWVTVEIKANTDNWQRIDTTFAATGADTSFLTNDANYVTRYTY